MTTKTKDKAVDAAAVADDALAAEAAAEQFVTFTVTIKGEDVELTTVRDGGALPRRAARLFGRADAGSQCELVEYLLGEEQLKKVDELDPTIDEFLEVVVTWSKVTNVAGK